MDEHEGKSGTAQSAPKKGKGGFFYGWVITAACGLVYLLLGSVSLNAGQIAIPVMVTQPDIMMDRTLVGLGFTVFILFQGLLAPIIGSLVSKKGARLTMILSAILIIIGSIVFAQFGGSSTIAYFLIFGVWLSFSSAMGSQVPCQTTISMWFVKKRGMAMAIMMAVMGAVAFLVPPAINAIIQSTGSWRSAFYAVAAAAVVGLVIVVLFIRNKPEDKGLVPDGSVDEGPEEAVESKVDSSKVYKTKESKTLAQALKTPAFWLFVCAALPLYFGFNINVSAGVLHFSGMGFDPGIVALGLSIQGIVALIVRFLIAPLIDRIEPVRVLAFGGIAMALAMFIASFSSANDSVLMFVYFICIGAGWGINLVCGPTCFANYFGNGNFSKIIGVALPIFSIVAGMIPVISGAVFSSAGSYNPAYIGIGVCCVIGVVCSLLVRFPKKAE
ncbi:MFS transporter [Raoultibacter timonensis]|uniref:MFS transporter n=1 Tax=Raoultibacter timonensis TaxID=1907662 RepID=A0ABM7WMV8_9ACTN|nr:MFS transporter [Raoultibacter timonensis]BDE97767.1 MFS transporter [Raoultibacter timonensis]BDF52370.1 MFS transporter [Raoultibacter timonensis]